MTDLEKQTQLENQLKALIDEHGLHAVIGSLVIVCNQKASHLESNWQDRATARVWTNAAKVLDTASFKSSVWALR